MFCKYCGKEIKDDSVFCKHCGKQLNINKEPSKDNNIDPTNRHKPRKIIKVVSGIILIILIITISGIFIFNKYNAKDILASKVSTWANTPNPTESIKQQENTPIIITPEPTIRVQTTNTPQPTVVQSTVQPSVIPSTARIVVDTNPITITDKLTLTGKADVFEGNVQARLKDSAGNVILETFTTAHSSSLGQLGPFEFNIDIDRSKIKTKTGTFEVYDVNMETEKEDDKVIVAVVFQ